MLMPRRDRRAALHLPLPARDIAWRGFVNTAADSPADVYPALDGPSPPQNGIVALEARSMMVYVADDEQTK